MRAIDKTGNVEVKVIGNKDIVEVCARKCSGFMCK